MNHPIAPTAPPKELTCPSCGFVIDLLGEVEEATVGGNSDRPEDRHIICSQCKKCTLCRKKPA